MRKSSADAIKLYRDKAKQEKIEYETKLEKKLEKQKKLSEDLVAKEELLSKQRVANDKEQELFI